MEAFMNPVEDLSVKYSVRIILFLGSFWKHFYTINCTANLMKNKYSKKELVKLVLDYSNEVKRVPKMKEVTKNPNLPSINQFLKNFKTWNNFLRESGLEINYVSKYSKEELIKLLIKFKEQNNRSPKLEDLINKEHTPSISCFFRHFGSWNNALREAGLTINVRKDYTKKELLLLLKKKSKELGRAPIQKEMNSDKNYPTSPLYQKYFGSWNNALREANLETKYIFRKWTKKEIISVLKNKYKELGKTPGIRDFDSDSRTPGKGTVRKLFGNWTNALREANIPLKKYHKKEDLIKILKNLAAKLNRTPTIADLKENNKPSPIVFTSKFGTYTAACLSAGLIPNDGRNSQIWKSWEEHCTEMARVIHKNVEIKKNNLIENGVPDIYVEGKNLFIDAKTCGYKEFREQVKKYCKEEYRLEFWCIFKGMENRSKKVSYLYAKDLALLMKKYRRKDLAEKCYQFINNIYSKDQTTLT